VWTGHTVNGYGRIGHGRKQLYAHRLAYEWAYGPIPVGRQITQRCGNTLCVRADHLVLRSAK
jgi:HNH endonuclease